MFTGFCLFKSMPWGSELKNINSPLWKPLRSITLLRYGGRLLYVGGPFRGLSHRYLAPTITGLRLLTWPFWADAPFGQALYAQPLFPIATSVAPWLLLFEGEAEAPTLVSIVRKKVVSHS